MRISFVVFLLCFGLMGHSQQLNKVDFVRIKADVLPIPLQKKVKGSMDVSFKMLSTTDSIYLDAKQMNVSYDESQPIRVSEATNKIWLIGNFTKGANYTVSFDFEAVPSQTLYFTGDQIWTQGQGKYTSHWLPSIDDMNDKIEFDLVITAAKGHTVVANGLLRDTKRVGDTVRWEYDMQSPMSSYLVAMAIGDFANREMRSASGVPIALFIGQDEKEKMEPTYRYTLEIFDFLEAEIGVPYPWQNYKQVPVRDFLYAGMENTTATIFSEAFVVDSIGFNDRNYVNVNAHELAHQWFGNLVTETESTHHWLQEGFATYYAWLAERSIFGEDYFYWKLYNSAEQLKALSEDGKGESVLDPSASSITFYEKGAWALHILKELIGEEAYDQAIKNYLRSYQFRNVTTENFLAEVRKVSDVDISQWETDWLRPTAFKATQAYESLLKSEFMERYFEVASLRKLTFEQKKQNLKTALTFPNDFIGQEAIYQLVDEPISETQDLYKRGFESNNLYVRQAIAQTLSTIPPDLKMEYESLLQDDSYATIESALYNLWVNFPKERSRYLDETAQIVGFQNKNVRQLWLVLVLLTEAYQPEKKSEYLAELKSYTSPEYSFEIRERAFGYVHELELYDATVLRNLVNASVHHTWRFRNFAREILDNVLENAQFRSLLSNEMNSLSEKEKNFLNSKLIE
ncbi:MAG: M1 family metallopeptidase [Flavobacteriales bacterium]|jgi:aminopeptidase N|nr:M1 family metallopeptidase [Flavobacteriales bacterium]